MLMTGDEDPELPDVVGGQFYYHTREEGFVPIGAEPPREPDIWVCRRVADYPGQRVPAGGTVAPCTKCRASIVFNPAREVNAPKVCMQCARIRPLPIES
jgi:hypothetical protein